ncbi:MAG: hypothetical protein V9G10_05485 [Candidatus Nanopelagicales bacterium]
MSKKMSVATDAARAALAKIDLVTTDMADTHIQGILTRHPGATPADVIRYLGREYTSTVAVVGGAGGMIAAAPGIGLAGAVGYAAFDIGTFTTASALYAISVAEVHGVRLIEPERRRMLVMAVLAGNSGVGVVEQAAGRTGAHWGKVTVAAIPTAQLRAVNKVLGANFVTKYGTKQGILVLGKSIPAGFGGLIGAAGNAAMSRLTVKAAQQAFGPAPTTLPRFLEIGFPAAA